MFFFRGGQYFTISILPWVPLFPFQQRWKWENFCCHYSIWRINTVVLFVLRSLLSIWLCVHVAVAWLYNATFFYVFSMRATKNREAHDVGAAFTSLIFAIHFFFTWRLWIWWWMHDSALNFNFLMENQCTCNYWVLIWKHINRWKIRVFLSLFISHESAWI